MDLFSWFFDQKVGHLDLQGLNVAIEKTVALHGLLATIGDFPISGLTPAPDGTMTLPISAGFGLATRADGLKRFVRLVSNDSANLTAAIPTTSPRWVLVGLFFRRLDLANHRVDGAGADVWYEQPEGSEIVLQLGTEGGGKPSVGNDLVPICYVRLTVGHTGIVDGDLDFTGCLPPWSGSRGGVPAQLAALAAVDLDNFRPYVVRPQVTNAMKVGVRPGRLNTPSGYVVKGSAQEVTLTAPGANLHRYSLVYLDDTGTAQVANGATVALNATATPPSFEGRYPVAIYDVTNTTTRLTDAGLLDVRPFARMARDTPNRWTSGPAVGGETEFTPGFTWPAGQHAITVVWYPTGGISSGDGEGIILDEALYSEDGAKVTLGAAFRAGSGLNANDKLGVIAQRLAGANPVQAHAPTHAADGGDPIDYATLGGLVVPGIEISSETTGQVVTISSFSAIINGRMRSSSSTETVDLAALGSPPSPGLNYLYAYWNSGAIAFDVSATEPDPTRRFKNGDTSRTFLCPLSIVTGGSHYARRFVVRDRELFFFPDYSKTTPDTTAVDGPCIASYTGDTLAHSTDVSAYVPVWAKFARFGVSFNDGGTPGLYTNIKGNGGAGATTRITGAGAPLFSEATLRTGSAQAVEVTNSANGATTKIWLVSYRF